MHVRNGGPRDDSALLLAVLRRSGRLAEQVAQAGVDPLPKEAAEIQPKVTFDDGVVATLQVLAHLGQPISGGAYRAV